VLSGKVLSLRLRHGAELDAPRLPSSVTAPETPVRFLTAGGLGGWRRLRSEARGARSRALRTGVLEIVVVVAGWWCGRVVGRAPRA
jgi:hypothetical protein